MTPQEYISSGMIEMYALGSLSAEEMKEVENMAAMHPEIKAEILRVQTDLENYATAHAIAPDPSVKDRIIANAINPVKKKEETKVIPLNTNSRWKAIAIAASIVLVLSIGYIAYLESSMNSIHDDYVAANNSISDLRQIISRMDSNNADLYKRMTDNEAQMLMLRDTATMNIPLNSVLNGHPMNSVVHWNKRSKEIAIDPMSLPNTDSTSVYVLWAISKGKPVNEGSFRMDSATGIVMFDKVEDADAFAVSLEKDGKTDAPAGPIYVMGTPSFGH